MDVNVQVAQRSLGVTDAGAEAGHPGKAVAAPGARAGLVPVGQARGNDLLLARATVRRDQVERVEGDEIGKVPVAAGKRCPWNEGLRGRLQAKV